LTEARVVGVRRIPIASAPRAEPRPPARHQDPGGSFTPKPAARERNPRLSAPLRQVTHDIPAGFVAEIEWRNDQGAWVYYETRPGPCVIRDPLSVQFRVAARRAEVAASPARDSSECFNSSERIAK
jgi:hypothetical protein